MVELTKMEIEGWTVTPALNLLERDGDSIRIEPLAMEVLVYLAERCGEVVSTDELIAAAWRGRVVGDHSVYQVIKQLRKAFDDDFQTPRFIQTVPKRGYRLTAAFHVLSPENRLTGRQKVLPHRLRWLREHYGYGVVVLLVAIALGSYLSLQPDSSIDSNNRPSIAVLPFANESAAGEDAEFFANGIHGELLTQLAKISALKVISRTSVMEYQERTRNLRDIGRTLGVVTILEGAVQRAGDTVRINVQLVDAETDEHLWAESYDRELTVENIFAIQRDMATSIAEALQAMLSPDEVTRLSEVPTQNRRAYDFYLSGNNYYWRGDPQTAKPLAIQMYQRAVEEDPQFALAFARLSTAHAYMYSIHDKTESRLRMVEDAMRRALALDPDLPEAHLALGTYYYRGFFDYENALRELSIAEQGNPGDSEIFFIRSFVYRALGEWDKAIATMERAIDLDPLNMALFNQHTLTFRVLREYAQAEQVLQRQLDIAPDYAPVYFQKLRISLNRDGDINLLKAAVEDSPRAGLEAWGLGWIAALYERDYEALLNYLDAWEVSEVSTSLRYGQTYRLMGQTELAQRYFHVAREQAEQRIQANPEDPLHQIALARALAGIGEREEAIRMVRRALERAETSRGAVPVGLAHLGAMWALIEAGNAQRAIEELDAYLAGPGRWSIEGLLPDPNLDPIRDDPRFHALVEKYKRQ